MVEIRRGGGRRGEGEGEGEGGRGEGEETDIKSNNPHLTGGEQNKRFKRNKESMKHKDSHMGVSKNSGTPKWMVYNGKPY